MADLSVDEVEVHDEGRRQPLVGFEFVDLSMVEGPQQRRDFVLVLDDRHISPTLTKATRDLAVAFIDKLGPYDRLAVVNTGSKELVHQLSTNRAQSKSLVQRLYGELTSSRMTIEAEVYARITFEVLRRVFAVLEREGASERRTVVLVSEGHKVFPSGPEDDQYAALLGAYNELLRYAVSANVAVYAIDPRGLVAEVPGSVDQGANGGASDTRGLAASRFGVGNAPKRVGAPKVSGGIAARRFGSLGQLAHHTGGLLTVDTNDLGRDIPRILQDSRQYYRLVYVQPDSPGGGRPTRRIQVKVSRPGVEIRARREYVPRQQPVK